MDRGSTPWYYCNMIETLFQGPKKDLLYLIKERGMLTIDEAESELALAKTTLRQHLVALEEQGLIIRDYHKIGQGRPVVYFELSSSGKDLFPNQESILLHELLTHLEESGNKKLIESFFKKFWGKRKKQFEEILASLVTASGKKAPTQEMRFKAVDILLSSEGFMPKKGTEKGEVIRECNCPFPGLIGVTQLPCKIEEEFLSSVLQMDLKRTGYIPSGSNACVYSLAKAKKNED